MPITQSLSSKGNVKKFTNNDLPVSLNQPIINSYYATSTSGQTVINLTFSISTTSTGYTDNFWLFIDGKKLDLGSSNDYTFTNIGSDGSSSQVTLNQSLPSGLNIQAFKMGLKPEIQFGMDNRFVQLYEAVGQGYQSFINTGSFLLTATSSAGTPPAGQFYSSIIGRAQIVDQSQDLKPRMGVERLMVQQLQALQTEFGPNGELISASPNDIYGLIRFGGNWTVANDTSGARPFTSNTNDFVEVTFYGTGLNLLTLANNSGIDARVSVDGGSEGSNVFGGSSFSSLLVARNYADNQVLNLTSNLSLGIHTVKLRNNSGTSLNAYGFEVLNVNATASNISINPGVGYYQDQKFSNTSQDLLSYSAPVTGTKGGRVVLYQTSSGSVGSAFTACATSPSYMSAASHTNEEVVRTFSPREFAAGRSDDFGSQITSTSNVSATFTLDDGTTSLVGTTLTTSGSESPYEGIGPGLSNGFITFTFVGTGLDIVNGRNGSEITNTDYSITIDGVTAQASSLGSTFFGQLGTVTRIASGLPYGTHVCTIAIVGTANNTTVFTKFIVYQPKTPSIPSGAIQLGSYNVMANFVANTVAGFTTMSTGVLRKVNLREITYVGSWSFSALSPSTRLYGYQPSSASSSSYWQYTFFGTGFDFRTPAAASDSSITVSLNGTTATTTNFPTMVTSTYGTPTFNPATGILNLSGGSDEGSGFVLSGLPLGLYTVKFADSSSAGMPWDALDIITPIHAYKSNLYSDIQNTLMVGSQAISDDRQITPIKNALPATKAWAQAVGISSNPTTTSGSFIPCPDMSCTIKTSGGPIQISYSITFEPNANGPQMNTQIYVDGIPVGSLRETSGTNGLTIVQCDLVIVPVSAGVHKVDVYWSTGSATLTARLTERDLVVREI